jgi:magnesium-transporting ATPase (P-type)
VYKVLALNCLVSAYMMSALYLRGLKQGDTQMTATGLVIAGLFFLLSQAKPVLHISAQKPTSTIFARAVLASLLGQFAVHFVSLLVGDLSAAREAVLNTAEASDLVLAAMGCCHDLMVPTIVGAGSDLLGTVRALQYAGVLREMTLSC